MNPIIRKATSKDIKSVFELNKKCLPIYYSQSDYNQLLLLPNYSILVAEINNKLVGYMVIKFSKEIKNVHILSIGICENHRSHGIGTKLIESIGSIGSIDIGCDNITLFVHVENEKGINFYKKNGFVQTEYIA